MNFIPTPDKIRIIPAEGPPDARIAIVGEAGGATENAQLRPFVGRAGGVLEQCLHTAGLIRSEVWLTNVVKLQPPGNNITPYFNGKTFSSEGWEWVQQLRAEMDELKPNVIVACGKTAMAALTGDTRITALRGYILPSIGLAQERKVLPIIHPAATLYEKKGGDKGSLATKEFKPYLYRYVISLDLQKAKQESLSPELVRPQRKLAYEFANVGEVLEWLNYYEHQPRVCLDIEVLNFELSCISFCSDPAVGISVPLDERWSLEEECLIYRGLQRVLGNPESVKVLQNGIFDIQFLLTRCGLKVAGQLEDTMVAHSVIYPELPKSLAFLVSVYGGTQAYYKDMVRFENIKGDS